MADEGKADPVRIVDEHHERLAEEERHDREVVAEQAARRQPDEKADERREDHNHGDSRLGLPVVAELRRRQDRVHVGTAAEEGDVAEVEQPRKADDDVQAEREQRVDQREEAIPEQVPFARHQREERGR